MSKALIEKIKFAGDPYVIVRFPRSEMVYAYHWTPELAREIESDPTGESLEGFCWETPVSDRFLAIALCVRWRLDLRDPAGNSVLSESERILLSTANGALELLQPRLNPP